MQPKPDRTWETLCERAASEPDPEKFLELIKEINDLLEEKRRTEKRTDRAAS
jgi:hypothetical protein